MPKFKLLKQERTGHFGVGKSEIYIGHVDSLGHESSKW